MKATQLILILIVFAGFYACQSDDFVKVRTPVLPDNALKYTDYSLPGHVFDFSNEPDNNILTDDGATLGRVLFYDSRLSINNAIACASCHKQNVAFSDPVAFSMGFKTERTTRNSLAISNLRFSNSLFWDGSANNLEDQVLIPVKNHIEMGMEKEEVLADKISKAEYYPPLFEKAFGTPDVTPERISFALSQFLRSMMCYNTKYDQEISREFSGFTASEKEGKDIFFGKAGCGNCHSGQDFNGWSGSFANIGLDMEYSDKGFGELFDEPFYDGMFKVPSLRNVGLTAPYMHDGRFSSLEEVVEHYNSKVQPHENLDYRLTDVFDTFFIDIFFGPFPVGINQTVVDKTPRKLNLTNSEKESLISFLNTLTDYTFVTDQKYSDPFR